MSESCILDRTGRPYVSSNGLYKTPSSNPNAYRPRPTLRRRTFENVTPTQRRDLINYCLGIYTTINNIGAALDMKSDFACSDGCFLQYRGTNKWWGKRLEPFINETYYARCNVAGENFDFHRTLWTASIALETHGQFGWIFDSDTGLNKIICASSIGNGMSPDSRQGKVYELGKAEGSLSYWGLTFDGQNAQITTGPFAGNFLIDGIIVNRQMVTQGYRVLGFDEAGKASFADLGTAQMGLVYEPVFTDQIMGYPGMADLVTAVGTVDDWNYYIGQAMKLSAAMAVTRKSKDGNPRNSGRAQLAVTGDETDLEGNTVSVTRIRAYETREGGLIELATNNDEEIGSVPFDRPSMNEEAFIERIETGFFAKHWPREFIYTAGFGRASARIGVVQARQKVWKRHRTLCRFGVQWLRREIAYAMAKGQLPENNSLFDPYNITLSTPAEVSVDEGNDLKGDLAMLGRGVTSGRIIAAKYGQDEAKVDDDNFNTLTRRMRRAKAIHSSPDNQDDEGNPILTIKEILQRIDNGGNPNQQLDLGAAEEAPAQTNQPDPRQNGQPVRPPAR